MKNAPHRYYSAIHNGSEKLIKTSDTQCEVVLQRGTMLVYTETPHRYPEDSGEELSEIPKKKFDEAKKKAHTV